jgi:hypothetical protein
VESEIMALDEKRSRYWIIGGGRFGRKAFERLSKKYPEAAFTIVDQDRHTLARMDGLRAELVLGEGARFLADEMDASYRPDWIIPAVPIHLAMEWMRATIKTPRHIELVPVPEEIAAMLPNPRPGPEGELYVSYADFICPDNCSEPIDRCTFTGKPRKGLLYKRIEDISFPGLLPVVIRSRQLAPGVGGYTPQDLDVGLEKVLRSPDPVLLGTACLCHGVIHGIRVRLKRSSSSRRRA